MRGLYIHVPFCLTKCPYCDFYSERFSRSLAEHYKSAVLRNLSCYDESFDTVYFGGGTPILLAREIADILRGASFCEGAEATVEANPCVTDRERLTLLFQSGVNRISFGVQSTQEEELRFLGRRHTPEQAEKAIIRAYDAGFRNISADLMIGLKDQTKASVSASVRALTALPLTHFSVYLLKIEENTPFFAEKRETANEDEAAGLYLFTAELLEEHGFRQYEISNFARTGYECRHNLKYWRCEEYLGVGPAAHSYYKGKRFCTSRDLNVFLERERQEAFVTDEAAGGFEEFAMLRLRLTEGLSFADCVRFGIEKETLLRRSERIPPSYLRVTEEGIALTKRGFLVSNAVIGRLLGY
ncbi:MAG: radical SAM family heme chaperone HemW [Bacteroides sp.]|nr:radical SAM family heme chaperone HemW [Eubacterium sp.]MCM1418292.1 radical SAM family heme chaperone HemW [Roseburia sp.]MCM1462395.1 radical SAM family heme chaperone HemW [Bacteroides sp.]